MHSCAILHLHFQLIRAAFSLTAALYCYLDFCVDSYNTGGEVHFNPKHGQQKLHRHFFTPTLASTPPTPPPPHPALCYYIFVRPHQWVLPLISPPRVWVQLMWHLEERGCLTHVSSEARLDCVTGDGRGGGLCRLVFSSWAHSQGTEKEVAAAFHYICISEIVLDACLNTQKKKK